jgi:eukaryotic-like serine/threonine-protein kinase
MTHDPDPPAHDPANPPAAAGSPAPGSAIKPGDTLGPYRVVRQLGASEASVVWRAQDLEAGRDVVIRQLIPGSLAARERSFLDSCRREVQKQQALQGKVRRVVLLKELIDDPRGAFVVTDYVSGASVEELLCSRPDPFDLVRGLRIVHATAKVLEQVHAHGLVHGGLRPSNIILRLSGGVQVCDLGITGLIAEQEALSPGSARYMAPELFHGVAGDAPSDIYSLGMVAYEMLAGRGAFEQAFAAVLSDPRSPAMRWMKWHTNARARPTPLHELNPRVPVRLSDLVARMMQKDRSKRIASAQQLLMAIQRHFGSQAIEQADASPDAFTPSGAQITATGPGDTAELPPPSKRPRVIAIAAAVVVVLTLGIWLTVSTIRSQTLAQNRALSTDALAEADRRYTAGGFEQALSAYQQQAQRWPDDADPLGRHGRAGALLAGAQLSLASGDYQQALIQLDQLSRLGEAGPADRQAVKSLTDEVQRRQSFQDAVASIREHLDAGRYAQARAAIQETRRGGLTDRESQTLLDLQVRIDAQLDLKQVDAALARANELADAGDLSGAINHLNGEARRLTSPRIDDLLKTLTLEQEFNEAVRRGESAEQSGDLAGALRAFGEALALRDDEALSGRVLALKSRAAVEDGRSKADAGDEAGALESFTAALGYDPDNTEARGWLARMNVTIEKRSQVQAGRRAEGAGDLEQAAGHYREALRQGDDAEIRSALDSVETRIALARAERLMAAGQLDEAGAELVKADRLSPDNPAVTEALARHDKMTRYRELVTTGDGFAEQGRFAQAKQAYRKARDVLDTDEINRRLDDTEFNHLIAQARGYIDNQQWSSARGILDTAAKTRITDELIRLRQQVQAGLSQTREPEDDQG